MRQLLYWPVQPEQIRGFINTLVDQVDGEIELKRIGGTKFRITFWVAERS
jgi:two-component sensor histidine kinase